VNRQRETVYPLQPQYFATPYGANRPVEVGAGRVAFGVIALRHYVYDGATVDWMRRDWMRGQMRALEDDMIELEQEDDESEEDDEA